MNNKICLWSGPRNISTALMYSFNSRIDTVVFDEPLYAHYLKVTSLRHPGYNEIINSYCTNGNKIVDDLILKDYNMPISFFKLMSHFIIDLNLSFLKKVKNIILLRNPLEVIASYNNVIKNPSLNDIGLIDQFKLFNFFKNNDIPFVVIDSNDILRDPSYKLKQLCEALNIDYDPKMLQWDKGPKNIDGIWAKYWYSSVHNTTGFSKPKNRYIKLSSDNELVYEEALKLYQLISKSKI